MGNNKDIVQTLNIALVQSTRSDDHFIRSIARCALSHPHSIAPRATPHQLTVLNESPGC
jgi:hypothetical protein